MHIVNLISWNFKHNLEYFYFIILWFQTCHWGRPKIKLTGYDTCNIFYRRFTEIVIIMTLMLFEIVFATQIEFSDLTQFVIQHSSVEHCISWRDSGRTCLQHALRDAKIMRNSQWVIIFTDKISKTVLNKAVKTTDYRRFEIKNQAKMIIQLLEFDSYPSWFHFPQNSIHIPSTLYSKN